MPPTLFRVGYGSVPGGVALHRICSLGVLLATSDDGAMSRFVQFTGLTGNG